MFLEEAIYGRRSVRQYTKDEVEKEKLDAILKAAAHAPSAMNSQPWAFAIIKDIDLLKEYSDRTKKFLLDNLDKYPVLEKYRNAFEKQGFNIFHNAGCLVIVYSKENHFTVYGDCCLAAQNLMLTAYSLGLGTCWMGFAQPFLNLPEVMEELNVPPGYQAVAPIIVGYPRRAMPKIEKNDPEIIFER